MTTSLAELTVAYQACMDEAIRLSPLMIERWGRALVDFLQGKEAATSSQTEKSFLRQATVALKTHRHGLGARFALELTQAIAADSKPGEAKRVVGSRSLSSISFDDLELMGDNQVQETLDGARLQQTLSQGCAFELAGFSARLSAAQGFHKMQADKNPLRPEVIASALLKALRHSPMDTASQSRLLVHGALLISNELQTLYITLNDLLAGHGVAPAAYGVLTTPPGKSREGFAQAVVGESNRSDAAAIAGARDTGNRLPSAAKGLLPAEPDGSVVNAEQVLTLDRLHRLMVGEYNDSFSPHQPRPSRFDFDDVPRNEFSHTVPAAMHVLAELKQHGLALNQDKGDRPEPLAPVALIREHLKTDAKSLGQSVAIEVVGLMIEQLTNDYRLLAPIKQIIANAEPAFLRLAVTDPRFFSDKTHPARRLLDVITTRSLAYSSEEAHGFAGFMLDLHEVAVLLTEEHASDAEHFAALLQDFEQRQLHRSRQADETRARAIDAMRQAEERNVLAGKIAAEIRIRPGFIASSPVVAAFLMGPWSQVMAKEWLSDQASGAHGSSAVFSLALENILRSVNGVDGVDAARQRRWLAGAMPSLLENLHAGLLTIDYPPGSAKEFFGHLDCIHRLALTPSQAETLPGNETDELSAAQTRRETLEKAFEAGDSTDSYHWLAPLEAAQSGFMDFDEASGAGHSSSRMNFQATQVQTRDAAAPASPVDGTLVAADEVAAAPAEAIPLKPGDWVELLSDMQWLRAQLTWISPQNTIFMFTSGGGRSHSMTSRVLSDLLRLNLVKVVNQHNVLDGALDSVAATAIRNSVDGSFSW